MFHRSIIVLVAAVAVVPVGTAAFAAAPHPKAAVAARNHRGHPTEVMVDGQSYKVCSKTVTDSCINPRQAGLHYGNTPMKSWPGEPASMKK
jgi:hypothetical protein